MEQGAFSRISEQILFKFRGPYIILTVLLTVWFAWEASRVRMDASLEKMVPLKHEYIQNLFKHKDELSLGNDLKIAIETVDGDIFTKEFLEVVPRSRMRRFTFRAWTNPRSSRSGRPTCVGWKSPRKASRVAR